MKNLLLVFILSLLLIGCGNDYSVDSFSKFQTLSKQNPAAAIDELKIFIYHNPNHPESKILIGQLLVERVTSNDRDMYLAQFYLKQVIETADKELSKHALELMLQAQLRRGMAPGDPEALVNLAKYARDTEYFERAAELFINASYEYLFRDELTQAHDRALDSLQISEKYLIDKNLKSSNEMKEYEEALALLTTIKMARGQVDDARKHLAKLKEIKPDLNILYEQLPSLQLLNAMNLSIDDVASKGVLAWRPNFMQSSDSKNDTVENDVLKILVDAEEDNKTYVNDLRSQMSYYVWKSFEKSLDKSKYKSIAVFVADTIDFYSNRLIKTE